MELSTPEVSPLRMGAAQSVVPRAESVGARAAGSNTCLHSNGVSLGG